MVGTKAKPKLNQFLEPLGRLGDRIGLTPNKITVIGFSISILTGVMIYLSEFLTPKLEFFDCTYVFSQNTRILFLAFALIFLFWSGFCDVFDGAVARFQNKITVFGGFLDSVLDRYSDAIYVFSIIFSGYCELYIGIFALIGSLLVSYTRARAEAGGVESKHMAVGIAERSERMLIICATIFLHGLFLYFNPNAFPDQRWGALGWGMLIIAIITQITVVHRILAAYKNFPKAPITSENTDNTE
ncbi:MAG: CDP-alcohol phosphatidyltransferase family protein [Promethearchaeota archaeon]